MEEHEQRFCFVFPGGAGGRWGGGVGGEGERECTELWIIPIHQKY